ncbi:MAG: DUF6498-containing protein [bacterium]
MRNAIRFLLMLASNLFPLYGLFFLGWSPFNTILIFWFETLIIFLTFQAKLLFRVIKGQWFALFVMFVTVPLIFFIYIHLVISTLIFNGVTQLEWAQVKTILSSALGSISLGIFLVLLNYAYELFYFIKNQEYEPPLSNKSKNARKELNTLYARIFFLQFTVIFGSAVFGITHKPILAVCLLVFIQVVYNCAVFFKSVRKVEPKTDTVLNTGNTF